MTPKYMSPPLTSHLNFSSRYLMAYWTCQRNTSKWKLLTFPLNLFLPQPSLIFINSSFILPVAWLERLGITLDFSLTHAPPLFWSGNTISSSFNIYPLLTSFTAITLVKPSFLPGLLYHFTIGLLLSLFHVPIPLTLGPKSIPSTTARVTLKTDSNHVTSLFIIL